MPSTRSLRSEPHQPSMKQRSGRQRIGGQGIAAPIASILKSFGVFHLMAIGFHISNDSLEVVCTKCGCKYTVEEMEELDDNELNRRHGAVKQNCSVLKKIRNQYNGQLRSPGVNHASTFHTHQPAYSSAEVAYVYSESPSLTTKSVRPQDDIISDSLPGKIFAGNGPSVTQTFRNYKDRLTSFSVKGLSRSMNCKPEQLAEAGLYACMHQGKDGAKCFACETVIYEISDKEDVWVKHAQLSPACSHIIQQKGQQFVDKVNDMMNAPKRKPITKEDVLNLGLDASWMKTITEMGFSLDDLVLVYLYKKSLQPEKPVVFADIQEPVHMILFQKDEAESNFSKFESQWPTGDESAPIQTNSSVTSGASNSTSLVGEDVETDSGYELPGEDTPCKICYSKRADIVLSPCYHMVSCESCTQKLKNCPICRKPIQGTTPVDF